MLRRSKFDLSHSKKLTTEMGALIPVLKIECIPGDSFNIGTESLIRFMPLIAPIMDDVDVCFHYFFVPYRLLWDYSIDDCWESFITFRANSSGVIPVLPYVILPKVEAGDLADYFGIPLGDFSDIVNKDGKKSPGLKVSALPFRAYDLIYNTWYRSPDVQSTVGFANTGGQDTTSNLNWLYRNWYKDYFTSCLRRRQLDNAGEVPVEGVSNPFTATASANNIPVSFTLGDDSKLQCYGNGKSLVLSNYDPSGDPPASNGAGGVGRFTVRGDNGNGEVMMMAPFDDTGSQWVDTVLDENMGGTVGAGVQSWRYPDPDHAIGFDPTYPHSLVKGGPANGTASLGGVDFSVKAKADSTIGRFSISLLRSISALQRFREKALDRGHSYVDVLRSFFHIKPRDSRLQLPEYIGGFKSPCLFSEVLQTSSTVEGSSPQGNMSGHGFSAKIGRPIKYFCPEHGTIMCLMSIIPRASYYQGVPKEFLKFSSTDYFFPQFQNLGAQAVVNQELYANIPDEDKDSIFGFQTRYSEYKSIPSSVHGAFRKDLNFWHLGRDFSNLPKLGSEFISCIPSNRIFANTGQTGDHIMAQIQHNIIAKRPLAKYVTPRII